MTEEDTRDCISIHLERAVGSRNCASPRTPRSTREKTPAFLSSGALATIIRNEGSSRERVCSNEAAIANRGADMCRDKVFDGTCSDNVKQTSNNDFDREESRIYQRHRFYTQSYEDGEIHISTFFGEESPFKFNNVRSNQDDELNVSKESTSSKRSFRIGPSRSRITPRRNSLPSRLSTLSISELAEVIINNNAAPTDVNNELPSSCNANNASVCIELSPANFVAVTPPPSYRSLIKQNLSDVPPSYECVTGLSLNIGQVCFPMGCSFYC